MFLHFHLATPRLACMALQDLIADIDNVIARYKRGEFTTTLGPEYGVAPQTVNAHLRKHGVEIRKRGQGIDGSRRKRRFTSDERQTIATEYLAGSTLHQLAARWGAHQLNIKDAIRGQGVTIRGNGQPRGRDRRVVTSGYVHIRVAHDDPYASPLHKSDWTPEHRYLVAKSIGRRLLPTETVHHNNGIRDDNRLENLELHVGHHGNSQRFRCRSCGSHDVEAISLNGD